LYITFSQTNHPIQKSSILEKSILEPEPQPVKAGNGKFGVCWAGLPWSKSNVEAVETPSQIYLGETALWQACQLWPSQHGPREDL